MPQPTEHGRHLLAEIANRHGVSQATVLTLAEALQRSGGSQAQFDLPELGGMGQWQRGGLVMVGDMFNSSLKSRVDALCNDITATLHAERVFDVPSPAQAAIPSKTGWPAELGQPSAQGARSDMRYAFFPQTNRLAVSQNGQTTLYDTTGHDVSGFGQGQDGDQRLNFSSQHGTMPLHALPVVKGGQDRLPNP